MRSYALKFRQDAQNYYRVADGLLLFRLLFEKVQAVNSSMRELLLRVKKIRKNETRETPCEFRNLSRVGECAP